MNIKTDRRSDIDILRAIAVLLVIGYHYFPSYIEIGYLGVDIFLVISGYLMVASYNSSDNAMHFLTKRAYRLMPGLLSVALICFVLIVLILRKDSLYDFSKEIITSITGISNYYYYSKLGYFDPGSQNKLFLMSWSLSLEIQYYILLALSFGLILKRTAILPILILLSLGSSFVLADSAVFYLIVSRLWEFLTGALLYFYLSDKGENKKKLIIIYSVIFLIIFYIVHLFIIESYFVILRIAAVVFSIFVISRIINFNSIFKSFRNVLLWIGESSYSLYLIHWPVLFFARDFNVESSKIGVIITLITVFILGKLNFVYIENKFTKILKNNNLLGFLIVILLIPMTIFALNERTELIKNAKIKKDSIICNLERGGDNQNEVAKYCSQFGTGDGKKIVLWGDSHINRIARPIINSLSDNESLYLISHNACPPLVDILYVDKNSKLGPCNDPKFGNKVVDYINEINPDVVILASRWPMYFNGYEDNLNSQYLINGISSGDSITDIDFSESINNTVQKIISNKVIILLPALELVKKINLLPKYTPQDNYFASLTPKYELSIKTAKKDNKLLFFDFKDIFCQTGKCIYSDEFMHYYQDDNHLSDYGADYVFSVLKTTL